jgi:hypothetical protein
MLLDIVIAKQAFVHKDLPGRAPANSASPSGSAQQSRTTTNRASDRFGEASLLRHRSLSVYALDPFCIFSRGFAVRSVGRAFAESKLILSARLLLARSGHSLICPSLLGAATSGSGRAPLAFCFED